MFFSTKIFKQIIKKTYKGTGLRIAHTIEPEGYYLSSGYWHMWMSKKFIPKEILAAMIEVCGELPGLGACHKVDKESTQIEMDVFIEDLADDFFKSIDEYRVTNCYLQQRGTLCSVLQSKTTKEVKIVSSCYPALVDIQAVDTANGEELPKGPLATKTRIMWGNADCYLAVMTKDADCPAEEEFLSTLSGVFVP